MFKVCRSFYNILIKQYGRYKIETRAVFFKKGQP